MQVFYADQFVLPLPPGHRFPMAKYRLLRDRLADELPDVRLMPAMPATDGELALAHRPAYIAAIADGSVDPCCGGRNLHGVQCFPGDARIADLAVGWGNGCAAVYSDYASSVRTWKGVILREYVAEGKDTPAKAVWKYAPVGKDGNNPPTYIADMENWITCWRAKGPKACYAERGIAVRQ